MQKDNKNKKPTWDEWEKISVMRQTIACTKFCMKDMTPSSSAHSRHKNFPYGYKHAVRMQNICTVKKRISKLIKSSDCNSPLQEASHLLLSTKLIMFSHLHELWIYWRFFMFTEQNHTYFFRESNWISGDFNTDSKAAFITPNLIEKLVIM